MKFVKDVYVVNEEFQKSEICGLISQMRSVFVSIPSNLSEGVAQKGSREFKQYLNIEQGSITELHTQIEFALVLNYIDTDLYNGLMEKLNTIFKRLFGLSRSIKK